MSRHTSAVLRRMAARVMSRCVKDPAENSGLKAAVRGVSQRRKTASTTSETMCVPSGTMGKSTVKSTV